MTYFKPALLPRPASPITRGESISHCMDAYAIASGLEIIQSGYPQSSSIPWPGKEIRTKSRAAMGSGNAL